jgi:DNA replication protein DnaD
MTHREYIESIFRKWNYQNAHTIDQYKKNIHADEVFSAPSIT